MTAQLRAELLKQRSTRAARGLFAGMLGLVAFAVGLHAAGLGAGQLQTTADQVTAVFGRGVFLATLFAALSGALAVTTEFRHGTIRPTLLANPARTQVIAAKTWAALIGGGAIGLAGCAFAAVLGTALLEARGIDVRLDAGDYAQLVIGGTIGAAFWAAVGVGIGSLVRNQVPALVGLCAWMLFVEGLLVGDIGDVDQVGRFAPGAAASALSGQDPDTLLQPGAALAVLAIYVVAVVAAGAASIARRDVA